VSITSWARWTASEPLIKLLLDSMVSAAPWSGRYSPDGQTPSPEMCLSPCLVDRFPLTDDSYSIPPLTVSYAAAAIASATPAAPRMLSQAIEILFWIRRTAPARRLENGPIFCYSLS